MFEKELLVPVNIKESVLYRSVYHSEKAVRRHLERYLTDQFDKSFKKLYDI